MIISHSRKYIFVKTKKTAGTSLEIALTKYCADEDVVTELVDFDEKKRRELIGAGARNYRRRFSELATVDKLRMLAPRQGTDDSKITRRLVKFEEHERAARLRSLLGAAIYDSYYKFTIVRNPYDQCISNYFWRLNNKDDTFEKLGVTNFSQFLRYLPQHVNENWRIYTYADQIMVDDFVRYERLEEDLARVSARIGLAHNVYDDLKSIQTKTGYRPKGLKRNELMDEQDRALIHHLCRPEIERFGYSHEEREHAQ